MNVVKIESEVPVLSHANAIRAEVIPQIEDACVCPRRRLDNSFASPLLDLVYLFYSCRGSALLGEN